jgi:predicted anti-sigma-YlaC factor YlaD
MNCLECQELAQRFLDGESIDARRTEVEPHLAICANCRELHAASQRLLEGMRLLTPPVPPADLARKVTARVLGQGRRLRFQKRVALTAALAASLVLVVSLFYRGSDSVRQVAVPTTPQAESPVASQRTPSLDWSVAEAGLAVAALTRRTASETVGQGRLLLPAVVPDRIVNDGPRNRKTPEPTAPLQEVKQTVSLGLEPVTTSARRAVDLFLREIPPMPLERKPGL